MPKRIVSPEQPEPITDQPSPEVLTEGESAEIVAENAAPSGLVFVPVEHTPTGKPNPFTEPVNSLDPEGTTWLSFTPENGIKVSTYRSQLDRAVQDRNNRAMADGAPLVSPRWDTKNDDGTIRFRLIPKISRPRSS